MHVLDSAIDSQHSFGFIHLGRAASHHTQGQAQCLIASISIANIKVHISTIKLVDFEPEEVGLWVLFEAYCPGTSTSNKYNLDLAVPLELPLFDSGTL